MPMPKREVKRIQIALRLEPELAARVDARSDLGVEDRHGKLIALIERGLSGSLVPNEKIVAPKMGAMVAVQTVDTMLEKAKTADGLDVQFGPTKRGAETLYFHDGVTTVETDLATGRSVRSKTNPGTVLIPVRKTQPTSWDGSPIEAERGPRPKGKAK